ncbi:MAG: MOSC domain-containing protein [Proteobacteria bacterium]|nr:MOSC domain-containing protein [Pseudomonadota bacterium]
MSAESARATIVAVCMSNKKSVRKKNIGCGMLKESFGLEGDAHGDPETHRQISLLAIESIKKMQDMGLTVGAGDFAENLTTEGVNLLSIPIGNKIKVGPEAVLEVTQHGKVCHTPCAIYYQAGMCIMPQEGIFAKVIKSGPVKTGDEIRVINE